MIRIPEFTKNCPEGMYEKKFTVTEDTTCGKAGMSAGDFAREMETVTEAHLASYGMSRDSLKAENKIWVISWNSLEIGRLPRTGEQAVLRIWPSKMKAGMYPRKYALYTADGEALAGASTLFILMDSVSRKMAMPTQALKTMPAVKPANEPKPPKMMMPFPDELPESVLRTVSASEIDKNGHLNNTHYIDWAEELAAQTAGTTALPGEIWIQYNRELLEGEQVTMRYLFSENKLYLRGYAQEQESFAVLLSYA